MADPVSMFTAATLTGVAAKEGLDYLNPPLPDPAALPGEVEEVDVQGQNQYTKSKAKGRKGRSSTILGSNNSGLKTVLG